MNWLLQDLVTSQVERRPEAPAIRGDGTTLTYRQVEDRSNQLARLLRDAGCRRGERVCVLAPRGAAAIVAMLGVFKADAIFVPVEGIGSDASLDRIVRTSQPACVLTAAATAPLVDGMLARGTIDAGTVIGSLEDRPITGQHFFTPFSMHDAAHGHSRPLAYRNRATNPAYVVFCGVDRAARGVVGTHAGVMRFVQWANNHFGVGANDRHPFSIPVAWDWSVYEILGALAAGAVLHPVCVDLSHAPHGLGDFVRRMELTQWYASPETLEAMAAADVVAPGDFPRLERVMWRGGAVSQRALRYWLTRLGHVRFTALYGSSEATIASAYYTVPRSPASAGECLPIGTPCPGVEVLVLDDALEPVAFEQVGEICIRGLGVSPGYWRDPEATRAVFLASPRDWERTDPIYRTGDLARRGPDGQIYVVGRRDAVVAR